MFKKSIFLQITHNAATQLIFFIKEWDSARQFCILRGPVKGRVFRNNEEKVDRWGHSYVSKSLGAWEHGQVCSHSQKNLAGLFAQINEVLRLSAVIVS